MNIEIVEFYPIKQNKDKDHLTGTLRVKLSDFGIHILGIIVSKRKDFWHFLLPGKKTIHHQTGKSIRFPLITFENREKQQELLDSIREKGRTFIEKKLADKEPPPIFIHEEKKATPQAKPTKKKNNSIEVKQMANTSTSKPKPSIPTKQWIDLPPIKTRMKKKTTYKNILTRDL